MKEQILKLRGEGKTYNEIRKLLNCSKSTISYHCSVDGKKTKKKYNKRIIKNNIKSNICLFCGSKIEGYGLKFCSTACSNNNRRKVKIETDPD